MNLYDCLYKKLDSEIAKYSKSDLFKASGCRSYYGKKRKEVRLNALFYLQKFYSKGTIEEYPIQKGSELVFVGDSKYLKYREVKSRLSPFEATCKIRVKETTTHVVLGEEAEVDKGFLEHNVTIITAKELNAELERLEKPYLLDEDENNNIHVKGLRDLFLSGQNENITLALEIVKSGGFPKELLTDLLIFYKSENIDRKIRVKLTKLLFVHIGAAGQAVLKKMKGLNEYSTEKTLMEDLGKLTRLAPEFDSVKIGQHMFEKYKVGRCFLMEYLPLEEGLEWMTKHVKGNELDLSDSKFDSLPERVKHFPKLTSVVLKSCRFTTVPIVLNQLPNLEKLDLSDNYLKALSLHLVKNQKLKVLKIGSNRFQKVPSVLFKMIQLEELHILFNPSTWNNVKTLKGDLERLKEALPNCKIVTNKAI